MKRGLSLSFADAALGCGGFAVLIGLMIVLAYAPRSAPRQTEICVTPSLASMAVPWQLYASDETISPNIGTDPNGGIQHPIAEGVGTLCGSFSLVPGHTIVLNGAFDVDGDGKYGQFGEYWAWMADGNSVASVTMDDKDVTSQVVGLRWTAGDYSGVDGRYVVP